MTLSRSLADFARWRAEVATALADWHAWLGQQSLLESAAAQGLPALLERLQDERLTVAFVAEFSRGKSELINALFFADYGGRVLPSSAGRTTMCPTELYCDTQSSPSLQLLPIQTRATQHSVQACKQNRADWLTVPLAVDSVEQLQAALRHVSETMRVLPDDAVRLGFALGEGGYVPGSDGLVEIPRWRHALINFPHPLLQAGLVVLDTPGLNAIGAEPELTLSLLPNAQAVLFVLAADAGVTQSDLSTWNEHLAGHTVGRRGRLVVLNKIDGLWDALKSPAEIEAEIQAQAQRSASILAVPTTQVYPVSAQKALQAKVTGDAALLARSRLPQLEAALSGELIPTRQALLVDQLVQHVAAVQGQAQDLLASRRASLAQQLAELGALRGKNRGVVDYLMAKARAEKDEFDRSLASYTAIRSVFGTLSAKLFGHLGLDALRSLTQATREEMLSASFSAHLSDAMRGFFQVVHAALDDSEAAVGELQAMTEAVYRKFSVEQGVRLGGPGRFKLTGAAEEVARLEAWCDRNLNTTLVLLTHEKRVITQRFFEEVAVQVRRAFEQTNRDARVWLRALMLPLETQVRERQEQLKRRLDSIRRIHEAVEPLEERISSLQAQEQGFAQAALALATRSQQLRGMLAEA